MMPSHPAIVPMVALPAQSLIARSQKRIVRLRNTYWMTLFLPHVPNHMKKVNVPQQKRYQPMNPGETPGTLFEHNDEYEAHPEKTVGRESSHAERIAFLEFQYPRDDLRYAAVTDPHSQYHGTHRKNARVVNVQKYCGHAEACKPERRRIPLVFPLPFDPPVVFNGLCSCSQVGEYTTASENVSTLSFRLSKK